MSLNLDVKTNPSFEVLPQSSRPITYPTQIPYNADLKSTGVGWLIFAIGFIVSTSMWRGCPQGSGCSNVGLGIFIIAAPMLSIFTIVGCCQGAFRALAQAFIRSGPR